MQSCGNYVLQEFLEKLIAEIRRESDRFSVKNLPFIIAPIWQNFKVDYKKYDEFANDLMTHDYHIIFEDLTGDWFHSKFSVYFYDKLYPLKEADFCYYFWISYDSRHWGYCECKPEDPDYREDKGCCGHGCDWNAPRFDMQKAYYVSTASWNGDEHDYWDFEDSFFKDDDELRKEKEEADRKQKIVDIKKSIEELQSRLKVLEEIRSE